MSAIRLREAAALLRERAGKATPAPWKTWGMDLLSDPVGNSNLDDGIPVVRGLVPAGERLRTHNIDYIAMMAPSVALALADWLDAEGALLDGQLKYPDLHTTPNFGRGALMQAVADAILGTPA